MLTETRDAIIAAILCEPCQPIHWAALADLKEEQGEPAREERWLAGRLQTDRSPLVVRTSWAPAIRKAVGNKGRKPMHVDAALTVNLYGAYWDGGSREEWFALDLETGRSRALRGQAFNEPSSPTFQLEPGTIVIQAGIFCGKRATPRVICHPLDLPKLSA